MAAVAVKMATRTTEERSTTDVDEESLSYDDLLEIAHSMSLEEACAELHYCCRSGDIRAVKALLEVFGTTTDFVNCRDDDGNDNTPLHLAAANGYADLVQMLVERGASVDHTNKSGNTPLHWAAANAQEKCVQILLSSCAGVDVLQKNNFGRSALTEGFTSQNTNVIQLLLEHESASEDRLIPGGEGVITNPENATDAEPNQPGKDVNQLHGVLHKFQFLPLVTSKTNNDEETEKTKSDDDDNLLFIRELPIAHADNPFGTPDNASNDTTGYAIWCASLIMARWMASLLPTFTNKVICELGSGCGVVGLMVAKYSQAKKVYVTDFNSTTLDNLRYNAIQNNVCTSISGTTVHGDNKNWNFDHNDDKHNKLIVQSMDWSDESTWPQEDVIDVLLGSDLIYDKAVVHHLKHVVLGLLQKRGGIFYYICKSTERDGMAEFIADMVQNGMILVNQEEISAPHPFTLNPLHSRDDESCFLHFHELTTTSYMLYEFGYYI